eukprot:TRINITY_DN1250_c1_g1_i1.p1 TRINITY_DN1250_c1_g1~~TRINITY_DN1250_c1_g1_i1.p1  ORF type:complete len:698 (-),score=66.59 TRINITY_DN1250_c1_g1_i1:299-2392(-)
MSNLSSASGGASVSSDSKPSFNQSSSNTDSSHHQPQQQQQQQQEGGKRKRSLPGNPDPDAEVIALSPRTLLTTNRFVCEICNKGFQRDQNLQLHRRGHNLPWKLKQRSGKDIKKRVYICPETTCVHHDPSRALGDLTGVKKHFCRKHGEKKWKCEKCSKRYAVQSDWKAHSKTCGTREYRCDCGTLFSRRDSFITHRAFCDALAEESARASGTLMPAQLSHITGGALSASASAAASSSSLLSHHNQYGGMNFLQQPTSSLSLYKGGIFGPHSASSSSASSAPFHFGLRSNSLVGQAQGQGLSLWPGAGSAHDTKMETHNLHDHTHITSNRSSDNKSSSNSNYSSSAAAQYYSAKAMLGLQEYEDPSKVGIGIGIGGGGGDLMPLCSSSSCSIQEQTANSAGGHHLYSNILSSMVLNSSDTGFAGGVTNWTDRGASAAASASVSRLPLSTCSTSSTNYSNLDSIYSNNAQHQQTHSQSYNVPQMAATALLQRAAQMGATATHNNNTTPRQQQQLFSIGPYDMAGADDSSAFFGRSSSPWISSPNQTQSQHNVFSGLVSRAGVLLPSSSSSDHLSQQQQQQQHQQSIKHPNLYMQDSMMNSTAFFDVSESSGFSRMGMSVNTSSSSSSSSVAAAAAAAALEQERLTRDFLGVGAHSSHSPIDHLVLYPTDHHPQNHHNSNINNTSSSGVSPSSTSWDAA